ncbi:MAG: RNA polymerase sigma factor [Paludibacter sp.]|nr:RNA polymerase sigma factor [Bacteroidales bacterium]MCM1069622.1 RNA polymerase sigma factor [Prevotella sp.]MCM1354268.1 RNA polymerase sigma factor [Bacteroides sp.]MCM1443107.1 RNA polymerase sigma factor [Muribaculum sp.]MCM1482342.1 RNA polymerase sigma factor [Paludibacter sp.]
MKNPFIKYSRLTDEALMDLVCRDSSSAFEELYRRYAKVIQGFLYRRLQGDVDLSADLLQDVFMRLWSGRLLYGSGQPFRPWIYTIAYNLLRNHYRNMDYAASYVLETICTQVEGIEDNTPLYIDQANFTVALQTTVQRLSEPQQLLFELRYTEELTVPEIAVVMGLPEGTVKSRLHTLLKFLRQQLKAYENI